MSELKGDIDYLVQAACFKDRETFFSAYTESAIYMVYTLEVNSYLHKRT